MALPTPVFTEQYDARKFSTDEAGDLFGTRVFRVDYGDLSAAANADVDGIETHVAVSIGINRFDAWPGQPTCLAQSLAVDNDGAKHIWKATYGYSSKFDRSAGGGNANVGELTADGIEPYTSGTGSTPAGFDKGQAAEARPIQIKGIKRTYTAPLEYDAITSAEVKNSAGDRFDPPAETEYTYLGYQVTFFREYANLRWTGGATARPLYIDTVNDAIFKIFGRSHAARTLRVSDVVPTLVWDKDGSGNLTAIAQIDVELLHKPTGWRKQIPDMGRRQYAGGGADPTRIVGPDGLEVSDPVYLDGAGGVLPPGGTIEYITAWEYPEKDLRELFT